MIQVLRVPARRRPLRQIFVCIVALKYSDDLVPDVAHKEEISTTDSNADARDEIGEIAKDFGSTRSNDAPIRQDHDIMVRYSSWANCCYITAPT